MSRTRTTGLPPGRLRRALTLLAVLPLAAGLAACGAGGGTGPAGPADELRLGYFATISHAAALIGVQQGYLAAELGPGTTLTTQVFNAGPAEVEALFAGGLDAAYLGPSPTINAYRQSDGEAVRIIAGASSGGAELVVRDGIDSAADLRGATLASPQLGNTQDVALRSWLTAQGLANSVGGHGDVTISPTKNSDVLTLFGSGDLDGAWVPEPYASQLVLQRGGHVLVDERDLWPQGQFVTTQLVVRTDYLRQHPQTVAALLRAHVDSVRFARSDPAGAEQAVDAALVAAGSKRLDPAVLDRAWDELTITYDPIAASLAASAEHAVAAGTTVGGVDLRGIYDLGPLDDVLAADGLSPVDDGGAS